MSVGRSTRGSLAFVAIRQHRCGFWQGRKELPTSPKHESIQEVVVKVSPSTSGSDNPELGTEALTRLVREVLEEVFEARIKVNGETRQARCLECSKKRDRVS
ncbi:hypothetical protein J1N35_043936 [Gossypium stocksii]|uniref:Uncharacterized protein n=1 Tax=Gossypium stocksii TaxID=47602 RepID=A0A9D3ZFE8_9ROSI|nr:hypothetical protein J1N35_043936 [Gossypium stocksii]